MSHRWGRTFAALAVVDTALSATRGSLHGMRWLTKPLLMPTLALSVARSGPRRATTGVALGFGTVGDVALLVEGEGPFLVGAGSFGLGHLAYVSDFLRARRHPVRATAPSLVALRLGGVAGPVIAIAAGRQSPTLGVAVAAYSAVLASTLAAAGQLDPALPDSVRRGAVSGAALFLLSDALIGVRQFLLSDLDEESGRARLLDVAVMATYVVAQRLLAESSSSLR